MALPGLVAAQNLADVTDKEKVWDNLGSNITATVPISSVPSLDLNFAANKSLIDSVSGNNLITFSRASTGTFVGSDGLIQTAASGVARFDHNPATGESLGLLIEEASTNRGTYSEQIDNAAWTFEGGAKIVTANATTAPDGIVTADMITTAAGFTQITVPNSNTGGPKTFSVFLKAGTIDVFQLRLFSPTQPPERTVDFNLSLGTATVTGGPAVTIGSIQAFPDGWYRCIITTTDFAATNSSTIRVFSPGTFYAWGAQTEQKSFVTSYIPTVASAVTRAADVASIDGANLSSFYNSGKGTIYAEQFKQASSLGVVIGDVATNKLLDWQFFGVYRTSWEGTNYNWTGAPAVSAIGLNRAALAYGTGANGAVNGNAYALSPLIPVASFPTTALNFQGAFSRIIFWNNQLPASEIAAITSIANPQISSLPSFYSVNVTTLGKDIAALNGVRNASTRNFVFIKGLTNPAQPRITTAAQNVASGIALQNAAMLKASPTTIGNYFFSPGVTLSGVSTRINGTPALSIGTSPFSGSTATTSILLGELRPQVNWRITEPMPSGTITSPEFAIPFETNDFVLFMKAGQN